MCTGSNACILPLPDPPRSILQDVEEIRIKDGWEHLYAADRPHGAQRPLGYISYSLHNKTTRGEVGVLDCVLEYLGTARTHKNCKTRQEEMTVTEIANPVNWETHA